MTIPKPVVLCILDGWGYREERSANAPALAQTPNFDRIWAQCPHGLLTTHGPDVGLPRGQMGNSEVGHTNIGAGRVVAMDLGQIDLAIEDGSFFQNAALLAFIASLPFVFSAVSEERYRERFFDPIMADMRRAVVVRDALRASPST